jgi:DNA polymerase I-like protein with 3'-5' exonuclease and polymerase domains
VLELEDAGEIERLARRLRQQGAKAVGIALHCTTSWPGHDPPFRALVAEKLALAVPTDDGDASEVYLLVPSDPAQLRALAPLFDEDGIRSDEPRPPFVVFANAQRALTILGALDLAPPRVGCLETAMTLLAEGSDHRREARALSTWVADRLTHSIADPARAGELDSDQSLAVAADVLVPLMRSCTPDLRSTGLNRVFDLEVHLLPAVIDMEAAGIRLDVPAFERIAGAWEAERKTATDEKRISRLDKLLSTYRWWSRDYVDLDGRIRCRLHPLAADSGRFSCTDPNLQQVPSEHTAPGLRGCFVPAPDHVFVIADYAQIELRVAAHLAPCDALRRVFREGRDPHRATAATITGRDESTITDHERQMAKAVNFGFLFGMGARRFRAYAKDSYGIELDEREASAAREAFFSTFPGIAAWHRRVRALSNRAEREDVTVATALGRRKRFEAGRFSYNAALNIPVQGTAAEGFKLAMTRLWPALRELGGRGVLVVHDEYIAEIPAAQAEAGRACVERVMCEAMASLVDTVPIEVEAKVAHSWADK